MKKSLLLFCLFVCSFALAQNSRFDGIVFSRSGNPAPGALVAVCTNPCTVPSNVSSITPPSPLVPICSSITDLTCSQPNPLTADGLGNYGGYVKAGRYDLVFYGSGLTAITKPNQIFPCDPNNCFGTSLTVCISNGMYVAGSACYPTVHQAIAAACSATPVGATVWIPPGSYPENTTLSVAAGTWCNSVTLLGSGSGQCDSVTPPSMITTTLATGHLVDATGANDWGIYNVCLKNTSVGSTGAAINLSSSQRATGMNIYISGPFLDGIRLFSSSGSAASTIWNNFTNVHCTGLATNGIGVLFDSSDAVAKVINNNNFEQDHCTGGASGVALKFTNSSQLIAHAQVINENKINCSECSASGGTGILFDPYSSKDTILVGTNAEGSTTCFNKGAGNTVVLIGGNISSCGSAVVDAQPQFTSFLNSSVQSIVQQFGLTPLGGMYLDSLGLHGAAPATGVLNMPSGDCLGTAGGCRLTINTAAPNSSTPSLQVGSSQSLTGTQGSTGAKIQAATGTTATNDAIVYDANGNAIDSTGPMPASITNPGSNFLTTYTKSTGVFGQAQPTLANIAAGIAPSGTFDFSGVTLFKLRVAAGLTTTVNGDCGFDSTNKNWHCWGNGVDNFIPIVPVAAAITDEHCVDWSLVGGVLTLDDSGAACGTSTLTNGAGSNVIPKSNGTNLVASSMSDDGTTVSTSEVGKFSGIGLAGAGGASNVINGVAGMALQISGTTVITVADANGFNYPGEKRVTTQFDKTSDTTLANIPGLTANVTAGRTYHFRATLWVVAGAVGGQKYAIAGTATATSIIYDVVTISNPTNAIVISSKQTALGGAGVGQAGGTDDFTKIEGTITVNAAGTLTVQFAQNVSNGTASSVLVGSTLIVDDIP